uniref:Uncharacterized protein n=1 Tax=Tanacetum cinerariifolium TaxID=118510 RepID=A0A699GHX5_TANCI|nr:hypothetical protein [Tanacetum cinerariifolium]
MGGGYLLFCFFNGLGSGLLGLSLDTRDRSMIGSLMYQTSSRSDNMFAVCACSFFQVTPKALHLHAVKRIFRLISWQCKKQTVIATSSAEAEYIAAASCCAQVLWIRNQLLDYGRKVFITEDTVRQALQLDDAKSINCFPNEEIFAEMARMGLARNVDSSSKFYMCPLFLQLMVNTQIVDLSSHTTKYITPSLTQKVFANMRRVGKGFSRVDTTLFEGMLMPQQVSDVATDDVANKVADVVAEDAAEPTPPSPTPAITPPPPQQKVTYTPPLSPHQSPIAQPSLPPPQQNTLLETCTILTIKEDASKQGVKIAKIDADEDVTLEEVAIEVPKDVEDDEAEPAELKEVIKVVTTAKLMTEVVTVAVTTITVALSAAREERPKPLKKQAQIEQDKAYARELEAELNANINWDDVIEQVKRKEKQDNAVLRYQALKRKPQTEAQARKNMMLEEEASKALKRKSKSSEQQAAKKQKLNEEVEELKTHLQIVPNDEDDVYTEATPLALKVPAVDYQIHTENNKPYYKIIRADETHQLFLSFISLLRNFNREDLEMLSQIFQERFASLKPKNFSDDFPLNTLKAMFKKPNVEASIWKNQRGIYDLAKVKSWKKKISFDNIHSNVRLEVKEESEVSLELLRFIRRQQQEGYRLE